MSFSDDMQRFKKRVKRQEAELYRRVVNHIQRSVKFGSHTTAAPGQPIDTGDLQRSFKKRSLGVRRTLVASDLSYAPEIEEGQRKDGSPIRLRFLRGQVGGFHSVKLTRIGFRRIVEHERRKMGI